MKDENKEDDINQKIKETFITNVNKIARLKNGERYSNITDIVPNYLHVNHNHNNFYGLQENEDQLFNILESSYGEKYTRKYD